MSAGRSVAGDKKPATDTSLDSWGSARSERKPPAVIPLCEERAAEARNIRAAATLPHQRQAADTRSPTAPKQSERRARPGAPNKWLRREGKSGADQAAPRGRDNCGG